MLGEFVAESRLFSDSLVDEAAEYLFCELIRGNGFVVSRTAANLVGEFNDHLKRN